MIVHVRLFARARDLAGTDVLHVDLPDCVTIAELRRRLATDYPALASLLERSALAVENEFAADSSIVSAESEIALVPPVSGGQAAGRTGEAQQSARGDAGSQMESAPSG